MMEQSRRLAEPLRWTRTGTLAVAALVCCAVLALVSVGIYAAVGGFAQKARAGCIEVTFPSTTGAAGLHACGPRARAICAEPHTAISIGESLRVACRRAGYPLDSNKPQR